MLTTQDVTRDGSRGAYKPRTNSIMHLQLRFRRLMVPISSCFTCMLRRYFHRCENSEHIFVNHADPKQFSFTYTLFIMHNTIIQRFSQGTNLNRNIFTNLCLERIWNLQMRLYVSLPFFPLNVAHNNTSYISSTAASVTHGRIKIVRGYHCLQIFITLPKFDFLL